MPPTDDTCCEACLRPFDDRIQPAMVGRQKSPLCEACFMGYRRAYSDGETTFDD